MITKKHDFVIGREWGKTHNDYPFRKMLAGESFSVENDPYLLKKTKKALATFQRQNPSRQFTVEKQDNGARIWRVK